MSLQVDLYSQIETLKIESSQLKDEKVTLLKQKLDFQTRHNLLEYDLANLKLEKNDLEAQNKQLNIDK
ncbi:hypothetical protein [Vaccinium witches'-broom phytoplasma]|nr:hypothetical protein [Vaccinium witches'-broom phytoplasma]